MTNPNPRPATFAFFAIFCYGPPARTPDPPSVLRASASLRELSPVREVSAGGRGQGQQDRQDVAWILFILCILSKTGRDAINAAQSYRLHRLEIDFADESATDKAQSDDLQRFKK